MRAIICPEIWLSVLPAGPAPPLLDGGTSPPPFSSTAHLLESTAAERGRPVNVNRGRAAHRSRSANRILNTEDGLAA